jgi:hypothetical protein
VEEPFRVIQAVWSHLCPLHNSAATATDFGGDFARIDLRRLGHDPLYVVTAGLRFPKPTTNLRVNERV